MRVSCWREMCVLSVMWVLERLNRRTSLPLVYFPAGRLTAVYFCQRCDSPSFLSPHCPLRQKTTLSPFSLSNLSLFYLCYVISLFPSVLCFLKHVLWVTPGCDLSPLLLFLNPGLNLFSADTSVKRLTFEKCLTKKMATCDVTKSVRLMFSFYFDRKFTGRPNTEMSPVSAVLQHASCAALPTAIW